jgi:hypothetical protein
VHLVLQGKLQVDIVDSKNNLYEYVLNPLDQVCSHGWACNALGQLKGWQLRASNITRMQAS